MAIDRTGEWWVGTEASDLRAFLEHHTSQSYPVTRVGYAKCACGHAHFGVDTMQEETVARRTCAQCGLVTPVLDSADYWDDAEPYDTCACPCEGERFELAVGFALREDGSIRWVTIALRCVRCGVLGAYADWEIDYSPSDSLFDAV